MWVFSTRLNLFTVHKLSFQKKLLVSQQSIVVPAIGSFCHFTVQSSQDESDNAVMAAIFYLFDPNMLPNCIVTWNFI